ncbi:MAG: DUF2202 domain-containing protein [Chlorobi bacterium]|nr:DUF2202 domain-containing protein [Chlorobiota bacterium]
MKKQFYIITSIVISGIFAFTACGNNPDNENNTDKTAENSTVEAQITNTGLTETEKNDLLRLREEEKLARDVYLYAADKYNFFTFNNISKSEQQHMTQVLNILTAYGLNDPASESRGVFNNKELQEIYDNLTAKVDNSLLDALITGAIIEDLDIHDIKTFISRAENPEVIDMYKRIVCGSRNHMRAFNAQLKLRNNGYTPQYISQSDFDAIIAHEHERCFFDKNNNY